MVRPARAGYLEALRERVVVFDGATATNLERRDLTAEDFGGAGRQGCYETLALTRPDVVAELHREFLDVGCDVVETDTFGALPWVLAGYGLARRTRELARRAAAIARDVASGYDGRWVAGALGPGGTVADLGPLSAAEQRAGYQEAASGLLEGGADLLVVETVQDLRHAAAAVAGCRRAMAGAGRPVPLQVHVTVEADGRLLAGTGLPAALDALEALGPDVVGLNCGTGPAALGPQLRDLPRRARRPLAALPSAGLPTVVDGRPVYHVTPAELAAHLAGLVTGQGVSVVGGCCGTEPRHLAAVVDACRDLEPGSPATGAHSAAGRSGR